MTTPRDIAAQRLIEEQAVQWLCDLRENNEQVRESFYSWLKQSPGHVREFLLATSVWKAMDVAGPRDIAGIEEAVALARASEDSATVVQLGATRAPARATGNTRGLRLIAACAALVVAGVFTWSFIMGSTYSTGIGEQHTIALDDGSIVYLNAQSKIRVRYSTSGRRVRLVEGEALFSVAQETARPFIVDTKHAAIQVVGTQFNVRQREGASRVSVVEGRVRVGQEILGTGEEGNVTPRGEMVKSDAPDIAATIAWRERRLVFRGETLATVAEEFSRYSHRPIHVEGETARTRRLAGTFNADDPDALMLFLKQYPDLTVSVTPKAFVIQAKQGR